ncbi:hypothetical protein CI41S_26360 [Bradyrhizobium ivorense]|nr:hypothetical protein CI41S_26360 [Bradyrhizobium ivorense]
MQPSIGRAARLRINLNIRVRAPGRDDLFGAGEADALAAVMAAINTAGAPLAVVDKPSQPAQLPDGNNTSVSRALNDTAPSIALDESSAKRPAAQ